MPRKKLHIGGTSELPSAEDMGSWEKVPERVSVARPDGDEGIDEVFSDFPQNEACIELSRIKALGGHPLFLEQMMPSAFSLSYVAEKYGGGKYQAKGRYKSGEKVRMSFEIEGDSFPVKRVLVSGEPVTVVSPPITERIIEREAEIPPPGSDLQTVMIAMMQKMMSQSSTSEMQILEKMKMYKELFAVPEKASAPLDVALSMFTKGLEAANAGGGGEGNFWLTAIKELREPLTQLAQTIHVAVTQPKQINPQQPGSPQPGSPVPASIQESKDNPMIGLMGTIKSMMPNLVNGAAKNSDPGLYTDFLLDQLPASAYPKLAEFLNEPGCLDKLAFLEPAIRFQQVWWEGLRVSLLSALNEEMNSSGDTNLQSGANSDTTTGYAIDGDGTA